MRKTKKKIAKKKAVKKVHACGSCLPHSPSRQMAQVGMMAAFSELMAALAGLIAAKTRHVPAETRMQERVAEAQIARYEAEAQHSKAQAAHYEAQSEETALDIRRKQLEVEHQEFRLRKIREKEKAAGNGGKVPAGARLRDTGSLEDLDDDDR